MNDRDTVADLIIEKVDETLKADIEYSPPWQEARMRNGNKKIFHLEASGK
jgi:replication factor C subunit 3/5